MDAADLPMAGGRPGAGLLLKPAHWAEGLAAQAPGLWFEVHAENHTVDGGPRLSALLALRDRHPVALHGVGLSLGGEAPLDAAALDRLARLVSQVRPWLVSEHLAWSVHQGAYAPDLLPLPRDGASLARVVANVDRVQQRLGRRIAVEHPAHYLALPHAVAEPDFLSALVQRTGCGLLLDLHNLVVGAHNLGFDAAAWLDALPGASVLEIHLAGHAGTADDAHGLLVDSHDAPVDAAVWPLLQRFVRAHGPRPLLIERDGRLPAFAVLMAERAEAQAASDASTRSCIEEVA
jgi:uncharacterized protein (UPF0276 family)